MAVAAAEHGSFPDSGHPDPTSVPALRPPLPAGGEECSRLGKPRWQSRPTSVAASVALIEIADAPRADFSGLLQGCEGGDGLGELVRAAP
jgi:hypothetical protein